MAEIIELPPIEIMDCTRPIPIPPKQEAGRDIHVFSLLTDVMRMLLPVGFVRQHRIDVYFRRNDMKACDQVSLSIDGTLRAIFEIGDAETQDLDRIDSVTAVRIWAVVVMSREVRKAIEKVAQ